jgi:hypothetical protein
MRMNALPVLMATVAAAIALPTQAQTCQATSGARAPTVVELYTSEGCSSCPPADRWLSTLKGRSDVLALAFHVNYWDRLGWPDRFASPEITARQHQLAQLAGARQVYAPQVVADGRDWRGWPQLPARAATAAAAAEPLPMLTLQRDGDAVTATVAPLPGATGRQLAGYWVVLEDGHVSRVKAGENAGETLRHDHVVRLYRPVAAWRAGDGTGSRLAVTRGVAEHPRRVAFVVTDATGARPLQAVTLAC